jgi:hypothetical protein
VAYREQVCGEGENRHQWRFEWRYVGLSINLTCGPQLVTISTGLLVSACVNRAPEGLFGAALAEVGVHDLLKVHSHVSNYTH